MTDAKAPKNTTGAIAKAAAGKTAAKSDRAIMQNYITKMTPEIIRALPKHIESDRFIRMLLTTVSQNELLAKCTVESCLGSYMQAAQLGMEVNSVLQQAFVIPYYNSKERRYEAQFQLGWQGMKDLAYRSGYVESIQVQTVRENDEFHYELGLHPDLKHVPARGDRGEATEYYAIVNLKDGGYIFEVMSKHDIEEHARKYSKSGNGGPWVSAFDQMAQKTVLKRALKLVPTSATLMKAISADETIKTEISDDMSEIAGTYVIDDDTGEVMEDKQEEQISMEDNN